MKIKGKERREKEIYFIMLFMATFTMIHES